MDLLSSLLTFALGAASIVIAQWVQSWRELRLDREKRGDDRKIDRGRTEAATLLGLQRALVDLRLALGHLHRAMDTTPSPPPELDAYTAARSQTALHASRVLDDPLRTAAEGVPGAAALVASTADHRARSDLLARCFLEMDAVEVLLGPQIRSLIVAGYVKLAE